MISKDLAKGFKDYLKPKHPDLYKKPYKSPKRFSNWEDEISTFLAKTYDPFTQDRISNFSIYTSLALTEYKFPTYYVGRDLAIALWNSSSSLDISDLNIVCPAVLFMIEKDLIITPDGHSLTSIGIASSKHCKAIERSYKVNGEGLFGSSAFIADESQYWYGIHNKSSNDKEHPYESYPVGFDKDHRLKILEDQTETEFLNSFRSFSFNLMFILGQRPDLIEQEIVGKNKGFGNNSSSYRNPIYLGKKYRIKYVSKKNKDLTQKEKERTKGSPKITHFRKGHIRTQRYGKNLEKKKTIFIDPVIVNLK